MSLEKRFFFLNENIGKGLTGVEASAFLRAKLFKKYLNIIPTYVSYVYNSELKHNRAKFVDAGFLEPDVPVINMFDYYCDKVTPAETNNNQAVVRQAGDRYELVKNDLDYRVFRNEKLSMYIKYHENSRLISYINYFDDNKKIYKRDYYDDQGYLSKFSALDVNTGSNLTESYPDRDGRVRILIHNDLTGDKVKIRKILIMNTNGMVTGTFSSIEQMIGDFLKRLSKQYYNDELFFVVDRNKQYYPNLRQIEHPNLHIIPIIHSMQTGGLDVMNDSLNSNFAEVFADLSDSIVSPIVFTHEQKEDIEKRLGVTDELAVIPHACHYEAKYVGFKQRDSLTVSMISRLSAEKQVDKAIDMFALVHKTIPQAKFDIWGYGSLQASLQEQIDGLGLSEVIKLRGIIDNPYGVFEKSGMSILTSRCESFSLVVMESLVTGCPVASFDIKYGPSSMIEDDINGCLSPLNDINAMADKVIEVLKSPKKHEKMCKNAYEKGKSLHAKQVAKQWEELLSKISHVD